MVQSVSLTERADRNPQVDSGHRADFDVPGEGRDNLPHTLVLVKNRDTEEEAGYVIVSPRQADPEAGFISEESPVGGILKGARTGQCVTINTPGGVLRLQVLSSTIHEGR